MKAIEKITEKLMYNAPAIVCVELDNEISLALVSSPPEGPGEGASLAPDFIKYNPFKNILG